MPFITQCPHADCKKYLLLEDEVQGTMVSCLCCKRPVSLMTEMVEAELVESGAESSRHTDPPAENRFLVRKCPKCMSPIKIPPERKRQAVSCLQCDFWGILN